MAFRESNPGLTVVEPLARAVAIGLGANLEAPREAMRAAVRLLAADPGLNLLTVSSLYLTEPQGGPPGQAWYHNSVAFFASSLAPRELLTRLLAVETALGRRRRERNGPRVIDLDWLAQGDLVVDEPPELIVPHPRLERRLFVLAPLAEVTPAWRHPRLDRSAAQLLQELDPAGQGLEKMGAWF